MYKPASCETAYAIGLTIVDPANAIKYKPHNYWRNGQTHYDSGRVGKYILYDSNAVYNNLVNGKPTMVEFEHDNSVHWVIVIGVRAGAMIDNLQYSDFIIIDPQDGYEKYLIDAYRFSAHKGSLHMKLFY